MNAPKSSRSNAWPRGTFLEGRIFKLRFKFKFLTTNKRYNLLYKQSYFEGFTQLGLRCNILQLPAKHRWLRAPLRQVNNQCGGTTPMFASLHSVTYFILANATFSSVASMNGGILLFVSDTTNKGGLRTQSGTWFSHCFQFTRYSWDHLACPI